jgi:predicted nucleic acid-binding protein
VDTSFLVSLYVWDNNSALAASTFARLSLPLLLTPLLETEIVNAFHLRIFRKESARQEINNSLELFQDDIRKGVFDPRPFSNEIFRQASLISNRSTAKFGTRALDLLHVASAIFLQAEKFYTFDKREAQLARSEGLIVRGC